MYNILIQKKIEPTIFFSNRFTYKHVKANKVILVKYVNINATEPLHIYKYIIASLHLRNSI